ncbi:MAG: dephospho-CoA kinase [Duncaniella sp.]|nr:dephospho-CoA kinase [Duncaniella sp.]
MNNPRVIAITGGIGSGKSVVSRIVEVMGYDVYDCDREAKILMDSSERIKHDISTRIAAECIRDGAIDRVALAEIVFSDSDKLDTLNAIVHAAVREHLSGWIGSHPDASTCFVETAILYQSGLDAMVDEVWEVDAPDELRIQRVMRRNNMPREKVEDRVHAQNSYVPVRLHDVRRLIVNDGDTAVLPRVEDLLRTER